MDILQYIHPPDIDLDLIADIDKFENWISNEEHTWLCTLKERRKIFPPIDVPEDWNQFHIYKLNLANDNIVVSIQQLVGNGPESFHITGSSSIAHLPPGSVPLQTTTFQQGQFIAVRPTQGSSEEFWLAKITHVQQNNNQVVSVSLALLDTKIFKCQYVESNERSWNI